MPAHRKSTKSLEASGAFAHNPSRAVGRGADAVPTGEIGRCPEYFTETEAICWAQILSDAAPGALTNADNMAVEALAQLMALVRSRTANGAIFAQLGQYLDRFGMNPKSRANVQVPKDTKRNSFAIFNEKTPAPRPTSE